MRLAVAHDPAEILDWPREGPASAAVDPDGPILAVCTNSSRDLCCGLDGRALVNALADEAGLWECSHLGGHRFAPTALHVPSGLVYGRLTEPVARRVMSQGRHTGGPDTESVAWLRGRSALEAPAQAAEIAFLSQGIQPDLASPTVHMTDDEAMVSFTGLPTVTLRCVDGGARPEQCGGESLPARSWIVTTDDVGQ